MSTDSTTYSPRILIIDDEKEMCLTLKELLELEGYTVATAESGLQGLQLARKFSFNLIICDIFMPDLGGFSLLSQLPPQIPVVMMTAFASVETARKAFKRGVRDYLVKPFKTSELLLIIKQTISESLSEKQGSGHTAKFITKNYQMQKILDEALRFAPTDVPILIEGESGVGKELLASFIHLASQRKNSPYLKMNCAAIPDSLLESELFGYEKGAFTGANEEKAGTFEAANTGTLLLDEIGDMPLFLQAKILRVLQEFRFSRIGSSKEITTDVRIIASTNRNLKELIQAGEFREDLFHRINGVRFVVPALRDRPEDISYMVDVFGRMFSEKYSINYRGIETEALECLLTYRWPGNIRELKHVMERAVILGNGSEIYPNHLPDNVRCYQDEMDGPEADNGPFATMEKFKQEHLRELIVETLRVAKGNRSEAADRLGISRKTLYNWMRRLEIKNDFA